MAAGLDIRGYAIVSDDDKIAASFRVSLIAPKLSQFPNRSAEKIPELTGLQVSFRNARSWHKPSVLGPTRNGGSGSTPDPSVKEVEPASQRYGPTGCGRMTTNRATSSVSGRPPGFAGVAVEV